MAPGVSKEVFIGNIPFNLSEEQIVGILNQAGQVSSFRLMTDSNTGKPRGYGFATFADTDSAASAVRNLNDYEVGGRKIRVDWPHQNNKDGGGQGDQDRPAADTALNGQPGQSALPALPAGVDLPANLKATDAISQTLSTLPPQTLLDILTQMKSLAISEPARTTELLRQQPQLSYAIFQALLLMGLVDEKIFQQVLEQPQQRQPPAPVQPPPMIPPPQQLPQHPFPPPPQPHPQYPGFPPPPIPGQQLPGMPPRPMQPSYRAPPIPQHQQPPQQPPQPQQQNQDQLLQQILSMTQQTVDQLPPTERAQVMAIRQQMGVR
ncbi:hypothetical protein LTR70_005335 [Exophiala xenobiotica]|uniref:RRM domain-containing protein n=1 Tax=Lithohypha guttulata TaxID=1690604 RepID=A0ABR0K5Q4_9EURO|nr:hypothetical protein LTR24_006665 [Lithohypha guttulata]KAK5318770.1 hypothetical protein LTR70_005335 [Exophiala xenobiotica]